MTTQFFHSVGARGNVAHPEMANAIRFLAVDAVEKAKSDQPGMPMGMADVLFSRFLKFDPADPTWPDRDRFVLSAGHGSMLLYAVLYLTSYESATLDELRHSGSGDRKPQAIRNMAIPPGSRPPPDPATALGMALAERLLNARFGNELVDHYTYVIVGDGCLKT
jgi:transketolase